MWKVRNGSNSAWITVGVLDPAGFNAGGVTAIANGGTGATTAGGALINLGGTSVGIAVFTAATQQAAWTALGVAPAGVVNGGTY